MRKAQEFPSKDKTVTLVVPYAAGGPTDRVARDLAEALRKPLAAVSVVVDNAAGAGSTIGTAKAARAAPDGYTLLLNHIEHVHHAHDVPQAGLQRGERL